MADKVPMEFSPYMGPDALRQMNYLNKNLYDIHTKRFCGYEDINGSQYEGTVENWGSELLLEARKILLDKPSLKNIFIENTMDFYFDIEYSGFTNTYDQENMLCAILRKDVFLSNRTYRIKFTNVEHIWIPRAESSSDPEVFSDEFIHSSYPPVLLVTKEDSTIEEIPLVLTDIDGGNTEYYFHVGKETDDMYDADVYPDANNTFITLPITDAMYGRACFWMCINLLKTFPPVIMNGNELLDKKFLTIGTDGHDRSYLYPIFNYSSDDIDVSKYIVKVVPVKEDSFIDNASAEYNYTATVGEIHILEYDSIPPIIPGVNVPAPLSDTVITYVHGYVKMSLYKKDTTVTDEYSWNFRTPIQGDYDYDGRTYWNKCYAWTPLSSFINNMNDEEAISLKKIPLLRVRFNDDSYLTRYEGLCENAYAGIHVDVTSDYSNNGVSKNNGTIHNLGDFDGLPSYFQTMIDDTIHRAHLEVYSIRDRLNKRNQSAMDKQTAGILIDTAIPQNELQKVNASAPVVIKYDWDNQFDRNYIYNPDDPNISQTNNVCELAYVDEDTFANTKIPRYTGCSKFVYHGNRTFSLGMMGFDPEKEMGRVYIVSNDKASYDNNETSNKPKAPLTFARICDIPTEFSQLTNIKGVAPTVVIDSEYVRTECNFSVEDKDIIYNRKNQSHILPFTWGINNSMMVWPSYMPPASANVTSAMNERFPRYTHLNDFIDISADSAMYTINGSGGTGYEVNDEFIMYIGGICMRGIIKTVDDGHVTSFKFLPDETDVPTISDHYVVRSNLGDRISSYETTTTVGSGSGLVITLTISEFRWNQTAMRPADTDPLYIDDVWAFYKDTYGNIWVYEYEYNEDSQTYSFVRKEQITGATIYENTNDSGKLPNELGTFTDVFIKNTINPISSTLSENTTLPIPYSYSSTSMSDVPGDDEHIFTDEDLSDYIISSNKNKQDTVFVYGEPGYSSRWKTLISYSWGYDNQQESFTPGPFQDLNLPRYYNKSNKMKFDVVNGTQPSLFIFDPTSETIETTSYISKDVAYVVSTKPILLSELITSLDNDDENPEIPGVVVEEGGYATLTRNVYINNEYDDSDITAKREYLSMLTREALVDKLLLEYPDSLPAKYEGTPYQYSKPMLIDFFMQNTLTLGRSSGNEGFKYTEGPESIYRKPLTRLFRQKDDRITDRSGNPIGDQPKGSYKEISTEIFNTNVKLDSNNKTAKPWNVFRLDITGTPNLDGLRMYDELNNDITDSTILIVNGLMYIATEEFGSIVWVRTKEDIPEEEET